MQPSSADGRSADHNGGTSLARQLSVWKERGLSDAHPVFTDLTNKFDLSNPDAAKNQAIIERFQGLSTLSQSHVLELMIQRATVNGVDLTGIEQLVNILISHAAPDSIRSFNTELSKRLSPEHSRVPLWSLVDLDIKDLRPDQALCLRLLLSEQLSLGEKITFSDLTRLIKSNDQDSSARVTKLIENLSPDKVDALLQRYRLDFRAIDSDQDGIFIVKAAQALLPYASLSAVEDYANVAISFLNTALGRDHNPLYLEVAQYHKQLKLKRDTSQWGERVTAILPAYQAAKGVLLATSDRLNESIPDSIYIDTLCLICLDALSSNDVKGVTVEKLSIAAPHFTVNQADRALSDFDPDLARLDSSSARRLASITALLISRASIEIVRACAANSYRAVVTPLGRSGSLSLIEKVEEHARSQGRLESINRDHRALYEKSRLEYHIAILDSVTVGLNDGDSTRSDYLKAVNRFRAFIKASSSLKTLRSQIESSSQSTDREYLAAHAKEILKDRSAEELREAVILCFNMAEDGLHLNQSVGLEVIAKTAIELAPAEAKLALLNLVIDRLLEKRKVSDSVRPLRLLERLSYYSSEIIRDLRGTLGANLPNELIKEIEEQWLEASRVFLSALKALKEGLSKTNDKSRAYELSKALTEDLRSEKLGRIATAVREIMPTLYRI